MKLSELLRKNQKITVLTGAGMSTESGLQDYRGNGGLWLDADPLKIVSVDAMNSNRDEFIRFFRKLTREVLMHGPNDGHRVLNRWMMDNRVTHILTQNIDGYHINAATLETTPQDIHKRILELHGSLRVGTCTCPDCGRVWRDYPYKSKGGHICSVEHFSFEKQFTRCNGFVRPNVVLYEENLDGYIFSSAKGAIDECDLLLVLGTSLSTYPVSRLPQYAVSEGKKLVIINQDPTSMDDIATLVINNRGIGEVLTEAHYELYEDWYR